MLQTNLLKKNIWIGKPSYDFDLDWDETSKRLNITISDSNRELQNITNVNWELIGSTGGGMIQNCSGFECHARGPLSNTWTVDLKVTVSNSCGTTIEYLTATPPPPLPKGGITYYDFVNQGNNFYTINYIENNNSIPLSENRKKVEEVKISVYDFTGNLISQSATGEVDISSLKFGFYILKAMVGQEIFTKKVIKI